MLFMTEGIYHNHYALFSKVLVCEWLLSASKEAENLTAGACHFVSLSSLLMEE